MAGIWNTPAGNLGIIPSESYFELQLDGQDLNAGAVTYTLVAGALPTGLTLSSSGLVSGNPKTDTTNVLVEKFTTKEFTVRLSTLDGAVIDRTFSLSVSAPSFPNIQPSGTNLGSFVGGDFVNIALTASETLVSSDILFSLENGQLPSNLTLHSNGYIQGYVITTETETYEFNVEANDGVNYDIDTYTIDITEDPSNLYNPILLTSAGIISSIRAKNNYSFQFEALDLNNSELTFVLTTGTLPPGISLSATTGFLTGIVNQANLTYTDYNFNIQVEKTSNPAYVSEEKSYTLRVLGQLDDNLTWVTDSNLGTIYAGEVSDLALQAIPSDGQSISYKLASNSLGTLPPGLQLTSDGLIVGRPSFYTSNYLYPNLTSSFTVVPYNQNIEFIGNSKTFSLQVVKRTVDPYDNLYISLMPTPEQREIFYNIITDSNIVDNNWLYRPNDLWFGRNIDAKVLFLSGLEAKTAAEYIDAITLNHYWKTLLFGNIKTARALDDNFNTIYEVVYVEIIDQEVNQSNLGPNLSVTWPTNQVGITTVYPNSFTNMVKRLEANIGYEDKGVLPRWMTSRQSDGRVLGFTRALVLFYTLPGESDKIAFRTSQYINDFNRINFTIDRYEWDNSLSKNEFVSATGKISGSTSSNIIIGLTGNINGTGTISGNIGELYITGSGTVFAQELQRNNPIYVSSTLIGFVDRIYSNSNIRLTSELGSTITNQPFVTPAITTKFDTEIKLGDTLVYNDTVIGTVKKINTASNLELFSDSTLTFNEVNFSHIQQDLYVTPNKSSQYLKFPKTNILS